MTGTPWEDPKDPGSSQTIPEKAIAAHRQQANKTHGEVRRVFEKYETMDEALNYQVIETIEDNYITELRNKYIGLTVVKTIYLVRHIMDRYGEISETDLKENQKIFDEALDTITLIDKYFERIYDCIQYSDGGNQP